MKKAPFKKWPLENQESSGAKARLVARVNVKPKGPTPKEEKTQEPV
jgi:hypothetical protein